VAINEMVRAAVNRIRPLSGTGPNLFTVSVEGWHLSAPTKRELNRMLWSWFNTPERPHP
jgi:hypothetical protein